MNVRMLMLFQSRINIFPPSWLVYFQTNIRTFFKTHIFFFFFHITSSYDRKSHTCIMWWVVENWAKWSWSVGAYFYLINLNSQKQKKKIYWFFRTLAFLGFSFDNSAQKLGFVSHNLYWNAWNSIDPMEKLVFIHRC